MGVEGTLNCPSLAIDPSMLLDAQDNEADVVYEEMMPDSWAGTKSLFSLIEGASEVH